MINGVFIEELKIIPSDKGNVLHMMRSDSKYFKKFGEIYFSYVEPGVIKGWKKHLKQTQHFAVPIGNIKLVLFDGREDSRTFEEVQEISIGIDNYNLVCIPSGVWYSFKAFGPIRAMIANLTDIPHDPEESVSKDIEDNEIPYSWRVK